MSSLGDYHLEELKRELTGESYCDPFIDTDGPTVIGERPFNQDQRYCGYGMPKTALTMIGRQRLNHLQYVIETTRDVPGDALEAGVWRGGASIFMRKCLDAYGQEKKIVWMCDSYKGLPEPQHALDRTLHLHLCTALAVSTDKVHRNLALHGIDGDCPGVNIVEGYFKDTLPNLPRDLRLSILRLDGDYYDSTMESLIHLYPRLSPGGVVIVDDYFLENCRRATLDYREKHGITELIYQVDWGCTFWRKAM